MPSCNFLGGCLPGISLCSVLASVMCQILLSYRINLNQILMLFKNASSWYCVWVQCRTHSGSLVLTHMWTSFTPAPGKCVPRRAVVELDCISLGESGLWWAMAQGSGKVPSSCWAVGWWEAIVRKWERKGFLLPFPFNGNFLDVFCVNSVETS